MEQGAAGREQGGVFHHLAQTAAMGGGQGDLPGMFPLDVDDPGAPVHVPQFQGKGLHQAQTAITQEHEDAPQAGMGSACPHAGRFGVLLPVPGFGSQQFSRLCSKVLSFSRFCAETIENLPEASLK